MGGQVGAQGLGGWVGGRAGEQACRREMDQTVKCRGRAEVPLPPVHFSSSGVPATTHTTLHAQATSCAQGTHLLALTCARAHAALHHVRQQGEGGQLRNLHMVGIFEERGQPVEQACAHKKRAVGDAGSAGGGAAHGRPTTPRWEAPRSIAQPRKAEMQRQTATQKAEHRTTNTARSRSP